MGRLQSEDVSWIPRELPDLDTKIYVVDGADFSVPANKGHEGMVYLTYIIEHYDNLPDVVLFFHPHQRAWHNNVLLNIDSAETIRRLSSPHVIRQGYMNARCHQDPGCPNWLHVDRSPWLYDREKKPEEPFLTSQIFHELHPGVPIPKAISQPCCAQFAVSGERIRGRPRSAYIHYRDWLLNTDLTDETSGRIMEYTWQYLFSGQFEFCPSQAACYCDGYGICFGGDAELNAWLRILNRREVLDQKLVAMWDKGLMETEPYKTASAEQKEVDKMLFGLKDAAFHRGEDPRLRALDCGRQWEEGDGF